jgi:hypothetical protein
VPCLWSFCFLVYEPLLQLYTAIMNSQRETYTKYINTLKLKLAQDDWTKKPKELLKCVLQAWLPVSDALLSMIDVHLPSPAEAQKYRVENVYSGPLDDKARQLIAILEMIPLSRFVPASRGWIGRPCKDRLAIASAFVAKAVYGFPLTRQLLQRLGQDEQLRRICGWETARQVPHESTFSRAFAAFADIELPQFVYEALIASIQKERLIGHIALDSTAIEARERFPQTAAQAAASAPARGAARRGRRPRSRWTAQAPPGRQAPLPSERGYPAVSAAPHAIAGNAGRTAAPLQPGGQDGPRRQPEIPAWLPTASRCGRRTGPH